MPHLSVTKYYVECIDTAVFCRECSLSPSRKAIYIYILTSPGFNPPCGPLGRLFLDVSVCPPISTPSRPKGCGRILRGQFKFYRDDGPVYRPLTLVAGASATGAWRKVFCANEYPRLVFKLMPSTEDMSYTTEEIRAF